MSQTSRGLANVTNDSSTVTGDSDTLWTQDVDVGDLFIVVGDIVSYEISSIVSDTEITLTAPYGGTTEDNVSYVIHSSFTPNKSYPFPERGDVETATIVKRAIKEIDGDNYLNVSNTGADGNLVEWNNGDATDSGVASSEVLQDSDLAANGGTVEEKRTTTTLTAATTLAATDQNRVFLLDASAGSFTVTLPTHDSGLSVTLVLVDATNDVTIEDDAASTVQTLNFDGESTTLVSDGSTWQLAGLPDRVGRGAIVESGSNSNGNYVRWQNGEQVCWGKVSPTANTSFGGLYRSSGTADEEWSFPAGFTELPATAVGGPGEFNAFGFTSEGDSSKIRVNLVSSNDGASHEVRIIAWGFWK